MERLKFEETNPKEREPETKIETYSERAIRIERPDAVFRIIYEIHDNLYQLEDFKNIDALAIEFVYDTKTKPEEISDNYFYQTVERLDLKNFLETNRTPIYFIDAVDSEEKLEKLVNTGMLLSVLEGTAGLYLGGSALSNAVEKIRGRKILQEGIF